jgi:malate dehydrogenase (oxaloacetate-decarboxylating)(NADP+)
MRKALALIREEVPEALTVGPILLGMSKPVQVLVPTVTARAIVNLTAISVAEAAAMQGRG